MSAPAQGALDSLGRAALRLEAGLRLPSLPAPGLFALARGLDLDALLAPLVTTDDAPPADEPPHTGSANESAFGHRTAETQRRRENTIPKPSAPLTLNGEHPPAERNFYNGGSLEAAPSNHDAVAYDHKQPQQIASAATPLEAALLNLAATFEVSPPAALPAAPPYTQKIPARSRAAVRPSRNGQTHEGTQPILDSAAEDSRLFAQISGSVPIVTPPQDAEPPSFAEPPADITPEPLRLTRSVAGLGAILRASVTQSPAALQNGHATPQLDTSLEHAAAPIVMSDEPAPAAPQPSAPDVDEVLDELAERLAFAFLRAYGTTG